ncbi:uncharacterized protein LOC142634864 [Castanea sativa]|uniref:uncharacterized protein LOC142634864 n=1 Tax=Castanea sativa TaxID=21020 RepID=UPI003F64D523
MSLFSWNCRGLGNPLIVNALKKAIRIEDPTIVFLMETKLDEDWMTIVRNQCGFKQSFIVPSVGLSGGLALFWKCEINIDVFKSSLSHIDAVVDGGDKFGLCHLSDFYGNPDTSLRTHSWNLLKELCGLSQLPWLVVGDFNEITCAREKEGGAPMPNHQMARFNNTINFCGLREVAFVGPCFTWIYQKKDGIQIRERLDRALANQDWISLFPLAKLFHKSSSASDHIPLLLKFVHIPKRKKQKKLFRFESMWLGDARCEKIVSDAWSEGLLSCSPFPIERCLEECKSKLKNWNHNEFGHVGKRINQLQKQLEWLELQPPSPDANRSLRDTRVELNCWLEKENTMWKQRSRLNWFQAGDRNTRFFHAKASSRFQKNLIEGVFDSYEVWREDGREIEEVFVDYYSGLFSSSNPSDFAEIVNAVQPKVNDDMNARLIKEFQADEVYRALK